jgi:outer membrane cobalamin receptor
MYRHLTFFLCASALLGQNNMGELRLKVSDPAGLPLQSSVDLVSQVNQYRRSFATELDGTLVAKRLPFGIYRLEIQHAGFARYSDLIEIRSAIPRQYQVTLGVAPVETTVIVTDTQTLLDPYRTGSINRIGGDSLEDRAAAPPGRSLPDLVNMQPGWLLEANGVLHPRGSEYQTQYVVDGIPLTENRSPAFAPEFDAGEVQSMSILTAGYPAEYGRKLGGIIEVTTARDSRPGFHGKAAISGGSFDSLGGDLAAQYSWGRNTLSLNGGAARTDRYLDPPVEQNFTNSGTVGNFGAHFERDLGSNDRIGVILRHEQSGFLVPNEFVQQAAGQRQDRDSAQTSGQFSYQHIFSPNLLGDLRVMSRDATAGLWSNSLATPIAAAQDRGFRETYLKGTLSAHFGVHEFKAGLEADFASISEAFGYRITDPSIFDPATPPFFRFAGRSQDREQALFAQDRIRLGNWTISAGLRFDHYRLLVDESAVSPRLGVAWYWPKADLIFRGSYDRVFQTPAFENILLASSAAVASLNNNVLRLPVRPSRGNFYEGGLSKGILGRIRLDANYFYRDMNDFADDDVLLNTGVSFPISFRKARIHGVEAKLEIPRWGPLSGFLSYSNMVGFGYLPVTGGLFLGDDAAGSLNSTSRFPITQDQRNTVRARFRSDLGPRAWAALGGSYGSGLPVEFDGTPEQALAQYGARIVDEVNFNRGRLRPNFSVDASFGVTLSKREKETVRFQADVFNLTGRLNVINFAGVFSGTALASPRAFALRLQTEF